MSDYVVIDIETNGLDPWRDKLLCVGIGSSVYDAREGLNWAGLLLTRDITIVAHTNYDLRWLVMASGVPMGKKLQFHDTKVMAHLLDSTQPLSLEALSIKYLGYAPPKPIRRQGSRIMFESKAGLVPIEEVPEDELAEYNRSDLQTEAALYEVLKGQLQRRDLWGHFVVEEAPFSKLLVEMEVAGLPFDAEGGEEYLANLKRVMDYTEYRLVETVGAEGFNLNSGDQVAKYLYSDLFDVEVKIPIPRLTGLSREEKWEKVESILPQTVSLSKVGRDYAYGSMVLEGRGLKPPKPPKNRKTTRPTVSGKKLQVLYGTDPWVKDYIEWRRMDKLRGYLEDWIDRAYHGRIYGRYDQAGTVTGRLSAREPNLQQVAKGDGVRGLFRGPFVLGDYAGLEARLGAHFSGDPVMLDIFREGKDLYGVLAGRTFGGPEGRENENRSLMKVLWLASQYGAQGETLANTMAEAGMPGYGPKEADNMLKALHNALPRLFAWREEVIAEARALGYVTTIGGRPRPLPDITSQDWFLKATAERQAVNSKVQGSAADIVRRAMLVIRQEIPPRVARILTQVHDEIIMERGPEWEPHWFPVIKDICENETGFKLAVPLLFDAKIAESWAEK